jgi:hypothetical protein
MIHMNTMLVIFRLQPEISTLHISFPKKFASNIYFYYLHETQILLNVECWVKSDRNKRHLYMLFTFLVSITGFEFRDRLSCD